MQQFGRIDIVVNNAGATMRGEFLELTDPDFEDGFALKYFGAVRITRAAWPHLKASGGSAIFPIIGSRVGRTPRSPLHHRWIGEYCAAVPDESTRGIGYRRRRSGQCD